MLHIVFCGLFGTGKSLLANSLIGRVAFESGVRLTTDAPHVLQTRVDNALKYSDTPGLDNPQVRAQAAKEISNAINHQTQLKLIFVVTLESGRIRPSDLATIDVILSAVEARNIDVNNLFSVIVNRCDDTELRLLQDVPVRQFVAGRFGGRFELQVKHILFLPTVSSIVGMDGALLTGVQKEALSEFVTNAPTLSLTRPNVEVREELYDGAEEDAREEITRLQRELDEINTTPWWLWYLKRTVGIVAAIIGRAAWIAMRAFL